MFRKRFIEALQHSGLSQAALAHELGVSVSTVSKWASGQRVPRDRYWNKIEDALGHTRAWFYAEDESTAAAAELSRLRQQTEAVLERLRALQAEPLSSANVLRVPLLKEPPAGPTGPPEVVEGWVDLPLALIKQTAGVEGDKLYALRLPVTAVLEGKAVEDAISVIAPGAPWEENDLLACRSEAGDLLAVRYRRGLPINDLEVLGKIVSVCLLA